MFVVDRQRRSGRARVLLLSLLLGLALLAPASPSAEAAVPQPTPRTANVVTADPLPTAQINGVVWTQAVAGDRLYVGGEFSRARPAGAAPGTNETARSNLAMVNLRTGALTSFAPRLNGAVKALALSPDGTLLYVGGSFTRVGTTVRNRFAVFRVADGTLHPAKAPSFNGPVNAIATTLKATFVGGSFTSVNGVARSRLAAVAGYSAGLTGWAPKADSTVNALTATGDRTKIIAGGSFDKVNGTSGRGLVALDALSGAMRTWKVNTVVKDYGPNSAILSLAADGDTVYGSGYAYGGGNFEGVFAASQTDGTIRWLQDCHGDTYSVAPTADAVYSAGHAHFCSNIGGFGEFEPRREQRALAVTRAVAGTVAPNSQPGRSYGDFGGQPAPALRNWFPKINAGTFTGMSQGPWSVVASGEYVAMAGEFTRVNDVGQQGIVRFRLPGDRPLLRGPEDTSASMTPTVTAQAGGKARVAWKTNWDMDEMTLGYDVLRDGVAVGRVSQRSTFWLRPTASFTDSGLTPGRTYRYQVVSTHRNDPVRSPEVSFSAPAR